jgi:hypothetical protein
MVVVLDANEAEPGVLVPGDVAGGEDPSTLVRQRSSTRMPSSTGRPAPPASSLAGLDPDADHRDLGRDLSPARRPDALEPRRAPRTKRLPPEEELDAVVAVEGTP